jgi:hypothetical protein
MFIVKYHTQEPGDSVNTSGCVIGSELIIYKSGKY